MADLNNIIYKGRDNEVEILFSFTGDFAISGLSAFDYIELDLGEETYATNLTPEQLYIKDDFTLVLKIGDATALDEGKYAPSISGYLNPTYNDGYVLNCSSSSKIERIQIKEC